MMKKDKYNIDKNLVKASFDLCFLKYQNMIFHVLNRLGFTISESPKMTNSIECMMDKSHILSIVFNNDENINFDCLYILLNYIIDIILHQRISFFLHKKNEITR